MRVQSKKQLKKGTKEKFQILISLGLFLQRFIDNWSPEKVNVFVENANKALDELRNIVAFQLLI